MTSQKLVGPKLSTIFPEVSRAFNERFAGLHCAFEKRMENKDVLPYAAGVSDTRISYLHNALRDFGTPLKSEDQLHRILKSGESILRKGPPNPRHRDIVDMYHFAIMAMDKAWEKRLAPPAVGIYEPIQVEDIGKKTNGIDIPVTPRALFNAVADTFNQKYPEAPLRHIGDLFEICRLGRDMETAKVYPEILLPYTELCRMMNESLRDMRISRYLVY